MTNATVGSFRQLHGKKLRIIELKYMGRTHRQIANVIAKEYGACGKSTIDHYFQEGGELTFALTDYKEHMADEALHEANNLIRQYMPSAIGTLIELSKEPYAPTVRARAAKILATPAIVEATRRRLASEDYDEIPEELLKAGTDAFYGISNSEE